ALKFYSSIRLDVRRISAIKDGDEVIGGRLRIKVVKNKVAPPFRQIELDLFHHCGLSREGSLLDQAATDGIVQKSGTWYAFEGERIGQGRENVKRTLIENPEMYRTIEMRIREKHDLLPDSTEVPAKSATGRKGGAEPKEVAEKGGAA
ncbi:MAG: DNA recombination/repair protein RecA, partial [SAR324 cluster bacterium]|nr:DNA recombination/repair protein RecA [SAR324 cluster bacterium]